MSLACPKCGVRINALKVSENFVCSSCSVALKCKTTGLFICAFVLSTFADFIIYPFVYGVAGTDWWPGFVLRISISGAVFFALLFLLVDTYGSIQVKDESED
ncbi:hypothetical protein [Undibacterium parvum]|nr:hypothetical protein [Undibacterium parvum]